MSEHSGNLLFSSEMTAEKAIKFLDEARAYFAGRPTGGEHSAYWANVYNADWCEEISNFISTMEERARSSALEALAVSDTNNDLAAQLSTSQARLSEAVKVLEMVMKDCEESGMMGLEYAVLDEKTEGAVKAFLATLGEENVR